MKNKVIITSLILCIIIPCAFCAHKYFFSHEYIYIKDINDNKFQKTSEIVELNLMIPSDITLNSLKYCNNLDVLRVIRYMSYNRNKRNLDFLKDINLSELQIVGEWDGYDALKKQTNLVKLYLNVNGFSNNDFGDLLNMDHLEILSLLCINDMNDISGIEQLASLRELEIVGMEIKDYSPLLDCKNLKTLKAPEIPEDIAESLRRKGVKVNEES